MSQATIARVLANSVCLANESGKIIRKIFKNGELGIVNKEGIKNYQTEADRAVERLIVSSVRSSFPAVAVVGEEDEECFSADSDSIIRNECLDVLGRTFPADAEKNSGR